MLHDDNKGQSTNADSESGAPSSDQSKDAENKGPASAKGPRINFVIVEDITPENDTDAEQNASQDNNASASQAQGQSSQKNSQNSSGDYTLAEMIAEMRDIFGNEFQEEPFSNFFKTMQVLQKKQFRAPTYDEQTAKDHFTFAELMYFSSKNLTVKGDDGWTVDLVCNTGGGGITASDEKAQFSYAVDAQGKPLPFTQLDANNMISLYLFNRTLGTAQKPFVFIGTDEEKIRLQAAVDGFNKVLPEDMKFHVKNPIIITPEMKKKYDIEYPLKDSIGPLAEIVKAKESKEKQEPGADAAAEPPETQGSESDAEYADFEEINEDQPAQQDTSALTPETDEPSKNTILLLLTGRPLTEDEKAELQRTNAEDVNFEVAEESAAIPEQNNEAADNIPADQQEELDLSGYEEIVQTSSTPDTNPAPEAVIEEAVAEPIATAEIVQEGAAEANEAHKPLPTPAAAMAAAVAGAAINPVPTTDSPDSAPIPSPTVGNSSQEETKQEPISAAPPMIGKIRERMGSIFKLSAKKDAMPSTTEPQETAAQAPMQISEKETAKFVRSLLRSAPESIQNETPVDARVYKHGKQHQLFEGTLSLSVAPDRQFDAKIWYVKDSNDKPDKLFGIEESDHVQGYKSREFHFVGKESELPECLAYFKGHKRRSLGGQAASAGAAVATAAATGIMMHGIPGVR
ncbi:MAG: hypothetical protein DI551_00820 [Micavibrio aeruginosavorus]|uniref:Uncharacterized protein n=1 Tax=Micavibrio aeruginosavorus TaxID=349221 RepID=A0A2W5N731_9BACT|nr:MAG: hypothetical protein DI551_00820 [Micavibrio aeruginosavorus]